MSEILNFKYRDKSKKYTRSYDIDLSSYKKMLYLSKYIYQASLSDIATESIKYLYEHENLTIRKTSKSKDKFRCTFSLSENTLHMLEELNEKYQDFSITTLVNMAISNALSQEDDLKNFKDDDFDK